VRRSRSIYHKARLDSAIDSSIIVLARASNGLLAATSHNRARSQGVRASGSPHPPTRPFIRPHELRRMPINKSIASRSFETSEGRNVLASLDFSGHLMDAWPWETKRISWMGAQARVCQSALGGRELNHCLAVGKKNSKRAAPVRALVVPVCCERGLYLRILIGRIHDANAHPP